MSTDPTPSPTSETSPEQQALRQALGGMMAAMARLAVARGLPFAAAEELMKHAFVEAAANAHPGLAAHRKVSRISTATGINRREVTRLTQPQAASQRVARSRSLASEVFAHWRTHEPYCNRAGVPQLLPRQGQAPSFEALAQEVTRDVHPRSLLDELCRLDLAAWDAAADTVMLARDAFVPQGDRVRLLGLLGDNVGDHLHAAVDNVLSSDRAHFEQAVFADGLSLASVESIRPAVRELWQALLAALVPALEARVEADADVPAANQRRLRVGLYTYQEGTASSAPSTAANPANPDGPPAATPRARAPRKP